MRCIGCGNCVRVCSQNAKQVFSSIDEVIALLGEGGKVAACIAPSFPAEFPFTDYRNFAGMLRKLGFSYVNEVAFGADLVAKEYRKLLDKADNKRYIATTCPAIVDFIEKYHPDLIPLLAPIVSPMIATSRAMKKMYGDDLKIVFIGPCIAKKGEALSINIPGEIDAVLTFVELEEFLLRNNISPDSAEPTEFDPPYANIGRLFPISRGLLQTAAIDEDLMAGEVMVADGRESFVEAIKAFEEEEHNVRFLEILACDGCIMGPGMSSRMPLFTKRSIVSRYVRTVASGHKAQSLSDISKCEGLDMSRRYSINDQRITPPSEKDTRAILERMGKFKPEDELNCGACGYETCRDHAIAIYKGLAESEMCLPYAIEQLKTTVQDLAVSNKELNQTKEALIQSEKMASMGQLAAAIAHEVNNPLGVVLMYAHLLLDEYDDNPKLKPDLELITQQADRCKKIVAGLLHFARQNKVSPKKTNIVEMIDGCLKTVTKPDNVTISVKRGMEDPYAEIDTDQVVQVITNLIINGITAMQDGGTITVETEGDENQVSISVTDTGVGIPEENLSKIFEPFFTTKQLGKGTGLGLSVAYGIIKMHRGHIMVDSNSNPPPVRQEQHSW